MRRTMTILARLTLLVLALHPTLGPCESFDRWASAWERSPERMQELERLRMGTDDPAQGPLYVLQSMHERIKKLDAAGSARAWQDTLLCHLELSQLDAIDQSRPGETLTEATKQDIRQNARVSEALGLARFRPAPATQDRYYRIFPGVTTPCGEIRIDGTADVDDTSDSVVAREIYQVAALLDQLRADDTIPALERMTDAVKVAQGRWHAFFENVVYDGFPWELYANEFAKSFIPSLRGTLAQPPAGQLRLVHPLPLMAVATEGKTTFSANFGIEALGWRSYETDTYVPTWGISALVSLRESRDESHGYGVLATFRGWSVGVVQRDTAQKNDEIQLVVGLDVVQWIQAQRAKGGSLSALPDIQTSLDRGWAEALAEERSVGRTAVGGMTNH